MAGASPRPDGRYDLAGWHLVRQVLRLKRSLGRRDPSLIDLGMGRGRDLMYFARQGFHVLGIDNAPSALERAARRARRYGIPIRTQLADLRTVRLRGRFNVVFSSCALNYLPRQIRPERFEEFRRATALNGIHAVNALTAQPRDRLILEAAPVGSLYRSGELAAYYRGWEILESGELEFDCGFGANPHRHTVETVVARNPG